MYKALYCLLMTSLKVLAWETSNILRRDCKKNAVFYKVGKDIYLNAPILDKKQVKTEEQCMSHCLLDDSCLSISISSLGNDNFLCHMYQEDRNSNIYQVKQSVGYTYYDTGILTNKIGPKCRQKQGSPCAHGRCIDNCQGGYDCITHIGSSCRDIKDKYGHLNLTSGYYGLTIGKRLFTGYCDMVTNGGAWLLIGSVKVYKDQKPPNLLRSTIAGVIEPKKPNYLPNPRVMRELHSLMGFSKMRFYCQKRSTVHIVTRSNTLGTAVINYFARQNSSRPLACDSYDVMIDDNSTISRKCLKWRNAKWNSKVLNGFIIKISSKHNFGFNKNRTDCDDNDTARKVPGVWKYFVM